MHLSARLAGSLLVPFMAAAALASCQSAANDGDSSDPTHRVTGGGSSGAASSSGSSSGAASSSGGGAMDDATLEGDDAGDEGVAPVMDDGSCPPNASTITHYAPMAAPILSPLDPTVSDPLITDAGGAPPAGWNFYRIDGAICRDGSP